MEFSVRYVLLAIIAIVPMVCDGIMQYGYTLESNNHRRFITGFLFGAGVVYTVGFFIDGTENLEQHSVLVSTVISIIGFFVTFWGIRLELHRTLKEKLTDQQRKVYADCYRKISALKTDSSLIYKKEFYDLIKECGSELSLSASNEVLKAFYEIESITTTGYENFRSFIEKNDPHEDKNNFETITENDEEIEIYHGSASDDQIFESKVVNYFKTNTPTDDVICEKMVNLLNAMRSDIGNQLIKKAN